MTDETGQDPRYPTDRELRGMSLDELEALNRELSTARRLVLDCQRRLGKVVDRKTRAVEEKRETGKAVLAALGVPTAETQTLGSDST